MNLAELRKRVAEVLGVSVSQNELAFEVFAENVSEILTEGITLKVPRVGFFQIKTANSRTKQIQQILFSTLPEDFTKEARTLYLTIDVYPRIKNPIDFDSQVFSISVGKPLLPLLDDDHNAETSFALLRKSIEERVRELISESDQIPNFNLWEESLPSEEEDFDSEINLHEHLRDINSEIDTPKSQEAIETDATEDFLKQLLAQNNFQITDDFSHDADENQNPSESLTNDLSPIFDDGLFDSTNEFSTKELSVDDLLNDVSGESLVIDTFSALPSIDLEDNSESDETALVEISPVDDSVISDEEESVVDSALGSYTGNNNDEVDVKFEVPLENTIQVYENIVDLTSAEEPQNNVQESPANFDHEEIIPDYYDAGEENEEETQRTDDLIFGENLEELNEIDDGVGIKISDLLGLDEQVQNEKDEISIGPPSSLKYLLLNQFEEENRKINASRDWNIEEEHLQEIVQEELSEYDSEKIAGENSRLLNQLLDEPVKKNNVEEQKKNEIKKIEIPVTVNKPEKEKAPEIAAANLVEEKEDLDEDEKTYTKVEWNWGDELKDEFGLGTEEEIETDTLDLQDFELVGIEEGKKEVEAEKRQEENDPLVDYADEYTREFIPKESEKIDLRKTRVDLFTKLEQTLEKEITFLKEELEKTKPIEEPEDVVYSKLVTEEKEIPKVDFKDEKVFLDFKTPPPKYEFYEEKQEPILAKPKRITILISPDEKPQEEKEQLLEPAPVQQEIKAEPPKRKFGKIFLIIFSNIIVASAVVAYFLLGGRGNSNQNSANQFTADQQKENTVKQLGGSAVKNTILETNNTPATNLVVDEFSDFPRTATPPAPIKQGTDLSTLNINPSNNTTQNQQLSNKSGSTEKVQPEKKSESQNALYKNVQGDIKINDMIFSDGKTFNFQHSSWRRKDLAEKEVSRLRGQGYNAFLIEAYLPEKGGTWYRVRIGSFKTEQEAVSFKNKNKF